MAVTKLWCIKGRVDSLIKYVEDPEKTTEFSEENIGELWEIMDRVGSYVSNPDKTEEKVYVSGINCIPEKAIEQWVMTKEQFNKKDKILAFHGCQSFKPGEVDAKTAHEIGIEFANEMWGKRFQVIVTTHLDKGHIHNHYAFNSVSFIDGKKYNLSKDEHRRKERVSDCICSHHGLSVITWRESKAPPRTIWIAEKNGEMTRNNIIKDDIDFCIARSTSMTAFLSQMEYLGYEKAEGQYLSFKIEGEKKAVFTYHLGKEYTYRAIADRVRDNYRPLPTVYTKFKKTTILDELIYGPEHLLYDRHLASIASVYYILLTFILLGVFAYKYITRNFDPPAEKRHYIHPSIRLEIRKMDNIISQAKYMQTHKIVTMDDLCARQNVVKNELDTLITQRISARNKMKRVNITPEELSETKAERDNLSKSIDLLRKELTYCNEIAERSQKYAEKVKLQFTHENRMEKEKTFGREDILIPQEIEQVTKSQKPMSVREQLKMYRENLNHSPRNRQDYER
jgi:hypothetical protein